MGVVPTLVIIALKILWVKNVAGMNANRTVWISLIAILRYLSRDFAHRIGVRMGIPKNLSSQAFGEARVKFLA